MRSQVIGTFRRKTDLIVIIHCKLSVNMDMSRYLYEMHLLKIQRKLFKISFSSVWKYLKNILFS